MSLPTRLVVPEAVRLTDRVRQAVEDVLAIPGRGMARLAAAQTTLLQVRGLLDRVEATRAAADGLLGRAEETRSRVDAIVGRAQGTRAAAAEVVEEIDRITGEVRGMLDPWRRPLARLQPVVDRLTDLDQRQIEALVSLTRRLPELADRLEADVLPLTGELRTVAPDLRDLLVIVAELDEVLGRVPGMKRIKRRVESEQAHDAHLPER
jgi:hypothetical protein